MKLIHIRKVALSVGLATLGLMSCGDSEPKQERPNILFIMSDDHAEQAISAYDHPLSELAPTPNIDRLADKGALFTHNYVGNSICGPSRATILTGLHSHSHGYMRNQAKGFDGSQPTLSKILQANGYQTAVVGKWHLVSEPTGFDFWQILNDQGEYNNPDFITVGDTARYSGYVTDLITGFTIDWLDKRDPDKPFFLMMHHKAPHRNWMPAERHYNLYDDVDFPVPETYFDDYDGRFAAAHQEMNIYRDMYEGHDLKMVEREGSRDLRFDPWPHVWIERLTHEETERFWDAYRDKADSYFHLDTTNEKSVALWKYQRYMEDYLASVKSVDESVGEVLDYLEEHDMADNTIVVYTTDQGFYLGEHGWFDKRFMYEESMIMPLVMRYPGEIEPGMVISELTQNIDFAPTFLDYSGIDIPDYMHGRSFRKLLEGEAVDDWRNSLYYHFYEYPGFHSVRRHYGVKTARYKLIHFYREDIWELFDLEKDPLEVNNIYGEEGTETITEELKQELSRLQEKFDVPEEHLE